MKKLLLSIFLITALSSSAQILTETFQGTDFPPLGWTTTTNVASRPWGFTTVIFNATGQTTFNITGGKSAAIGWIAQDQIADLTSPTFSLVGYSAATFAFNAKVGYEYMVDPFPAGNLEAQISNDGGTLWTTLWVEEDQGVFVDYVTLPISLDLAAYVGQSNLKIRFYYTGNDADSVSVDDVLVSGTLGVNEVLSSSFKTFPNPVNNVVTISNSENISLSKVTITDINGRTVKSIDANNLSEIQINVSDLNAGVYFMNINSEAGKAVKKFIKN
jgi:hypothetical protein